MVPHKLGSVSYGRKSYMSEHLTIAILGASNVGGTLGRAWSKAGQSVAFGVRDPGGQNTSAVRQDLGDKVQIGSVAEALASNPAVVVLALPGAVVDGIVATYVAQLDDRIIIDATNGGPPNSFASLQERLPRAHMYRAFN